MSQKRFSLAKTKNNNAIIDAPLEGLNLTSCFFSKKEDDDEENNHDALCDKVHSQSITVQVDRNEVASSKAHIICYHHRN
jgi:hypothetical protein